MTQIAEIMLFIRKEGFYPIEALPNVDLKKQAEDSALRNPGTLRVEDMRGNILWSLQ